MLLRVGFLSSVSEEQEMENPEWIGSGVITERFERGGEIAVTPQTYSLFSFDLSNQLHSDSVGYSFDLVSWHIIYRFSVFFSALFFRQRVSDNRQREASHSRPASDSTEVSGPPSPHLFSDDPHDRPFRGECFQELLTVGDWQLCGLWTLCNYVMSLWHVFFPSTFNLSFMSTEICLYWIDSRFLRSCCTCFCLHVRCILSVNLTKEMMAKFDLWKECLLLNSSILLLLDKGGWE